MGGFNTYINGTLLDVPEDLKKIVVQAQVDRSEHIYKVYFDRPDTERLVNFFFKKIYSLEGKEERDHMTRKTIDKVKSLVKDTTRERLEKLLLLNDITDYLDSKMAQKLFEFGWDKKTSLTMDEFETLYKSLNNRHERKEQLELLLWNFSTFFDLSRKPLIKALYKPIKIAAKMFKASMIFTLFDEAYTASTSIGEDLFHEFLNTVRDIENDYINRLLPN